MIDPLTLAVIRGGLEQATEEMDLTLKRAAFSPVISEGNDLANGCYEPDTGEVIVQGKWGLALFIGIMQFTTQAVIKEAKRRGVEEGDVFLVNDPFSGGTHLMDMLVYYYQHLMSELPRLPETQHYLVRMEQLVAAPDLTVTKIYQQLDLTISPHLQTWLQTEAEKARHYRSAHQYQGHKLGIPAQVLLTKFQFVYQTLGYEAAQ